MSAGGQALVAEPRLPTIDVEDELSNRRAAVDWSEFEGERVDAAIRLIPRFHLLAVEEFELRSEQRRDLRERGRGRETRSRPEHVAARRRGLQPTEPRAVRCDQVPPRRIHPSNDAWCRLTPKLVGMKRRLDLRGKTW